ncbi:PTS system, N-acetylglucosamine-specific IIBC subunit [Caldalkalibacillus thermarum TA2.A1]|uniref:N-acetylglucosamine-specific PTS transporter subunit IIBC n=1 Tax=Caldalkalibacillus thermarum (strain TA2.A1) TaxID=986075 RepID=F5L418_CALTT|nr:N-acetylglucosamine-specific PTS transporter subunit IIBC [Caldalkalibacillus thermarum]EGL83918.1 PTS system, N-acetylglucosamine-specific IIBC subunit [Caldalkalibacillus thermarum TA2.A1]QZT34222.1 N-acetylglucosamine-specific PTS transporter subunit IIBC [Caldalkalibacillus thermarum TA2.A1]
MLAFLQRIGRALMLPVAVLPAAALLLRLGQEDLLNIPFMAAAGDAIFANLALIFAIGVAIGLAKDGHGSAALAGAVGYFVLTYGMAAINDELNMSVLGGILSGVVAGLLYNRYHNIKLPEWLGFFGGRRFVPIVTAGTMVVLAGIFGFVWVYAQNVIDAIGQWIIGAGALGVGVYGFLNRLLIPIGLHHVINSLIWFVFGEYNGATGDLHRFFAGDPDAGIFMAGFFPIMMFGLPAACLAMYFAAKREKRKAIAGMLFGIGFTSFLTGITEPVEFTFMFLSPLLYVVHALLTGTALVVAFMLDVRHGFGFSAGAIDYLLNFGIATNPGRLIVIGLVYAAIYFVLFYTLITKLDLKTPGREDDDTLANANPEQPQDEANQRGRFEDLAQKYTQALGGKDNLETIDNCITRLRLKVKDMSKVDEAVLKRLGAKGVIKPGGNSLQVIIGTDVEFIADAMRKQQ